MMGKFDDSISFYLQGSISTENVRPLIQSIYENSNVRKLSLYINSHGGVVSVTIGLFNFIKTIKNLEIITYNVGYCDSAAILLFLLGQKRFVSGVATFYTHPLQIKLNKPQTISSLTEELKSLKKDRLNFIKLLSENSNISARKWNYFMKGKGAIINSSKAIKLGIANGLMFE
ncbi:MAG: ATP-dependent Clp protease proteolytic subunit [Alphaproteobacteria bacterium]|nr:ATP-dependent Clp protease proteolytic subunit [Alphaproteobacteria bacterium]